MNKGIIRKVHFGSLLGALGYVLVLTFAGAGDVSAARPVDDGGGGGGGGTPPPIPTPGPTPSPPQYRLHGEVYRIGGTSLPPFAGTADVRGWSRFETLSGDKVKADHLSVSCGGGGTLDQDDEHNAGFTDVEFTIGPAEIGQYTVQCYHQATFRGVTYTERSTAQIQIF